VAYDNERGKGDHRGQDGSGHQWGHTPVFGGVNCSRSTSPQRGELSG
jgi:hypothetical protein